MTEKEIVSALRVTESRSKRELLDAAADLIEKLTDRCARYAEEIAVAQERTRWIPVTERLPEVWRNDETSELVNYMIYSLYFGVDIGNYHAEAKTWLCVALPCTVTHWMPLPEWPEETRQNTPIPATFRSRPADTRSGISWAMRSRPSRGGK